MRFALFLGGAADLARGILSDPERRARMAAAARALAVPDAAERVCAAIEAALAS